MIKQLHPSDFPLAAEVIRASFATIATDFDLTPQNCPTHTSFTTTAERLQNQYNWGWLMYGLYDGERLVGFASLSKDTESAYELHNLAVLPEHRHKGYGKRLLDFYKANVKELGGGKINLSIIDENAVLKNWYATNGFIHSGTKLFEQFPFTVGFMEWEVSSWDLK
jgi:GNAT superfamily N-acetyltransferase